MYVHPFLRWSLFSKSYIFMCWSLNHVRFLTGIFRKRFRRDYSAQLPWMSGHGRTYATADGIDSVYRVYWSEFLLNYYYIIFVNFVYMLVTVCAYESVKFFINFECRYSQSITVISFLATSITTIWIEMQPGDQDDAPSIIFGSKQPSTNNIPYRVHWSEFLFNYYYIIFVNFVYMLVTVCAYNRLNFSSIIIQFIYIMLIYIYIYVCLFRFVYKLIIVYYL